MFWNFCFKFESIFSEEKTVYILLADCNYCIVTCFATFVAVPYLENIYIFPNIYCSYYKECSIRQIQVDYKELLIPSYSWLYQYTARVEFSLCAYTGFTSAEIGMGGGPCSNLYLSLNLINLSHISNPPNTVFKWALA